MLALPLSPDPVAPVDWPVASVPAPALPDTSAPALTLPFALLVVLEPAEEASEPPFAEPDTEVFADAAPVASTVSANALKGPAKRAAAAKAETMPVFDMFFFICTVN
jgi:hypothetical protein